MPTAAELARVHQRIDDCYRILSEIKDESAGIKTLVEKNVALCGECRPKLMGNGKEGLETRIVRLEEGKNVSKVFIGWAIGIAGAAGSVFAFVAKLVWDKL